MKASFSILLIVVFGLLLRFPLISGSFWLDEAAQALESSRPLLEQHKIAADFQPPLFHYLVRLMLYFSNSDAWLRSISVISGVISIVFIYLIVKTKVGAQAAMVAAFLLIINPFHIYFSQELRPYALAMMFACISWWALVTGQKRINGVAFVLATVGGLYSMYLYPMILLSQLVFIFIEGRARFKSVLVGMLIAGVLFAPWLPLLAQQLMVGSALQVALPGWSQVVSTPILKALPMVMGKFVVGSAEFKDSSLFLVLAGVVGVIVLLACVSLWKNKQYRFLVYWFVVPVLVSWAVSFFIPVIQPKRVMTVLPAMTAILAAWSAGKFWSRRRMAVYFVGLAFLGFTMLYWFTPKYQREDWRTVVGGIEEAAKEEKSVALFSFPEPFAPWSWYSKGSVPAASTKRLRVENELQLDEVLNPTLEYQRVYVFDYLTDLTDPNKLVIQWLTRQGYEETAVIDGGNVGFVRVYDSL